MSHTPANHATKLEPQLVLAATTTLILWASAFPGIRAGLIGYAPGHLVLLRFIVASLVLLIVAPFTGVRVPKSQDVPKLALLGLIGITAYNLALSYGETHITSGVASLLVNTAPIFTALLAVLFLNERIRPWGWLGLMVSFAGAGIIALTSGEGFSLNPWALLVLLAAILQSSFFVLQKPLFAQYRPLEITCYVIWSGTLFSLGFLPGFVAAIGQAPVSATLAVVYLGVFPAALAYLTWAYVLSRLSASRTGSLLYAVPVLAFVIAWVWLRESPTLVSLLGGVLALAGVVIVNTLGREQ